MRKKSLLIPQNFLILIVGSGLVVSGKIPESRDKLVEMDYPFTSHNHLVKFHGGNLWCCGLREWAKENEKFHWINDKTFSLIFNLVNKFVRLWHHRWKFDQKGMLHLSLLISRKKRSLRLRLLLGLTRRRNPGTVASFFRCTLPWNFDQTLENPSAKFEHEIMANFLCHF